MEEHSRTSGGGEKDPASPSLSSYGRWEGGKGKNQFRRVKGRGEDLAASLLH